LECPIASTCSDTGLGGAGRRTVVAKKKTTKHAAKPKQPAKPKPPAKAKTPAPASGLDSEVAEVVREIAGIAARVSDADRAALLNAARALETKGKIQEFNREMNVAAERAAKRRRELTAPEYRILLERTEDDFFIIQLDDARVFFNKGEMREITRICHAASSPADGARRLFKWFENERSDLLTDAGINTHRNPYLIGLHEQVVHTYTLKDG
jgi:hypothetical protein